jgi:GT2 family glycosyltransferase
MLALLHRRPRLGVVGNVQVNALTGALDHVGMAIDPKAKPVHDVTPPWRFLPRRARLVPAVTAACALIPRAVFRELGGFDERFRNGGEDVDFCFRARAAGYGVAVALRSRVRHHVSASPGRKRHDEANSRRLAHRWGGEFARLSVRPWCASYLARHWGDPRDFDRRMALQALLFLGHVVRQPPAFALAGQQAMLAAEEERWTELLGPWTDDPPSATPP